MSAGRKGLLALRVVVLAGVIAAQVDATVDRDATCHLAIGDDPK